MTALQEINRAHHIGAPLSIFFLSAEKAYGRRITEAGETELKTGSPAKLCGARIENADHVVRSTLNRYPHGLAKEALQHMAPGIVDISPHHIETPRGPCYPDRLLGNKKVMGCQRLDNLIFEGAHFKLTLNKRMGISL
jgi:hypothetical protein